ncbi:uncharacterized protein LOC131665064 [Phymastichus coffea]|uniref:uncharacterized protein LOC131665064 n=1 Tax=Phymastichus coffea TaxID=108790 RepID=UPI00273C860A|nr:uncharacterized protein LOC131665064 [Phymastichus coffea]
MSALVASGAPLALLVLLLLLASGGGAGAEASSSEIADILQRPIRAASFPPVSNTGIFVALAVPLEDPANSVSLSYFFEANYGLPDNSSLLAEVLPASRRKRSIDRSAVYALIRSRFESAGFPGRHCLLRSICEASEHPFELHNGLLGDVLRVVFTPSSSRAEDQLPDGVVGAELAGRSGDCSDYRSSCSLGLFDLIGVLQ